MPPKNNSQTSKKALQQTPKQQTKKTASNPSPVPVPASNLDVLAQVINLTSQPAPVASRQSSTSSIINSLQNSRLIDTEEPEYVEEETVRSPTPEVNIPRRGGFFSNIAGTRPATLYKQNKLISDSMRRDPHFLQNAGVTMKDGMTLDQLNDVFEQCQRYAKVENQQERDRAKIEKQVRDVTERILSYLRELPDSIAPLSFITGIMENLKPRPNESPVQHLTRIKVVEMPIKKLTSKQTATEFDAIAQMNEAKALFNI